MRSQVSKDSLFSFTNSTSPSYRPETRQSANSSLCRNQGDAPLALQSRCFRAKFQIKSETGFATALALTLLPLFLIGIFGMIAVSRTLQSESKALGLCRAQLFKDQSEVAEILNRLIAFNPQALRLRIQRQTAEVNLRIATMSGNPAAISAAAARLAFVITQQTRLALTQNNLYSRANIITMHITTTAINELAQSGFPSARSFRSPKFFLIRSPAESLTPEFRAPFGFEKMQEAILQLDLNSIWNSKYFFEPPLKSQSRGLKSSYCSATLVRPANSAIWVAQLSEDRLLSNSAF